MVCNGLIGKVTDFTTKSSKSQPEAVYASAPTSVQVAVPAPTSMPVTGVAQTNDQRLVETWQKLKLSVKSLWHG